MIRKTDARYQLRQRDSQCDSVSSSFSRIYDLIRTRMSYELDGSARCRHPSKTLPLTTAAAAVAAVRR